MEKENQDKIPENANEECPGPKSSDAGKSGACDGCPNQGKCSEGKGIEEDPSLNIIKKKLSNVKNIILVLSGKADKTRTQLSALRMEVATRLGLRKPDEFAPLWVVDFP